MIASLSAFGLSMMFAIASWSKFRDARGTRRTIRDFGFPSALAPVLPALEMALAAALLVPGLVRFAAGVAAILLLVFAGLIGGLLARGERPNCHCFGSRGGRLGPFSVARNVLLAAIASWVASEPDADWPRRIGFAPSPLACLLVIAMLATGAAAGSILADQYRRRVRAAPVRGPAQRPGSSGRPPGDRAPLFDRIVASALPRSATGLPILALFVESGCTACHAALAEVAAWADRFRVAILVTRGDPAEFGSAAVADSFGAAAAFGVWGGPEGVLIDPDGRIASPLAKGILGLRALAATSQGEWARDGHHGPRHPRQMVGGVAPAITGTDRNGRPVTWVCDPGREALLIHWDPDCPFCQELAPQLEAWSAVALPWAPSPVVMMRGRPGRDPGLALSAPVIAGAQESLTAFGLRGTPSAVLIGADRRIVSPVARGPTEVMSLAQGVAIEFASAAGSEPSVDDAAIAPRTRRAQIPFLARPLRRQADAGATPNARALRVLSERLATAGLTPGESRQRRAVDRLWWPVMAADQLRALDRDLLRSSARDARRSLPGHAFATWRDCTRIGIEPEDYLRFALWRPELNARAGDYFSRTAARRVQEHLIRHRADATQLLALADKAWFCDFCLTEGMAAPRLLAVARYGECEVRVPLADSAWQADLFVKPQYGSGGHQVERWTLTDQGYVGSATVGGPIALPQLVDLLRERSRVRPLLVQLCLENDPVTRRFTSGGLATLRIVTGRFRSGEIGLIAAALKMPVGAAQADNFVQGNAVAQVDLQTGRLLPGQHFPDRFTDIDRHPETGARFAGEKMPQWEAAVSLAKAMHARFESLVIIAFDIAPTPDGPVIVEANNRGDLSLTQFPGAVPLGRTAFPTIVLSHLSEA